VARSEVTEDETTDGPLSFLGLVIVKDEKTSSMATGADVELLLDFDFTTPGVVNELEDPTDEKLLVAETGESIPSAEEKEESFGTGFL